MINPGLTLPAQADTVTRIDARRDLYGKCLVLLNTTFAMTTLTGIGNNLAVTMTMRAGLLD